MSPKDVIRIVGKKEEKKEHVCSADVTTASHTSLSTMPRLLCLLLLNSAAAEVYFEEGFDGDWESRWVSGAPAGKDMGKWEVTPGKWYVDAEVNKGLATTEDMRHHSITSKMKKPSSSVGKDLVIQFSAKYEAHQYAFCGGGYIKLLPDGLAQNTFGGDDEYHIMFGPDLCGYSLPMHHLMPHPRPTPLPCPSLSLLGLSYI